MIVIWQFFFILCIVYYLSISAVIITYFCLKATQIYLLTINVFQEFGHEIAQPSLLQVLCGGTNHVSRAASFSRGLVDRSASKLSPFFGKTQFHKAVRLRSSFSCWVLVWGHSQLLKVQPYHSAHGPPLLNLQLAVQTNSSSYLLSPHCLPACHISLTPARENSLHFRAQVIRLGPPEKHRIISLL